MGLEAITTRRLTLLLAGTTPQKAEIYNLEKWNPFTDHIEVSFNPSSIRYTATPQYYQVKNNDSEYGYRMYYTGNIASSLTMDLLFDTTTSGDSVQEKFIDFLVELTRPEEDSDPPQPPQCKFVWGDFTKGDFLSFNAVVANLQVNYTYFLANGTPIRAEVDITFKEPDDVTGGTNPTSRSEARKVWTVVQGQTLDWIAFKEYGDSSAWRHIARANNLQNPRALRPGTVLRLPPLP
jgi:LysM repeat protein